MPRRTLVALGVAGAFAVSTLSASASGPLRLTPTAGCDVLTDAAGDAVVVGAPGEPNAPDFDITGVSYRLSDGTFSTVVRVPGLARYSGRGTGDSFFSYFTINGHAVEQKASRFSPFPRVDKQYDAHNFNNSLNELYIDGTYTTSVLIGSDFDPSRGFVTLSIGRESLEQALGGPVTSLTKPSVESVARAGVSAALVDDVVGDTKAVTDVSANTCF